MTTKVPVELSSTPGIVDGSNATAITIDSSQNVLVGTTDNVVQTNTGTGNGGIVLRNNNYVAIASDGSAALELNRLASAGEIANFRKNGTTVGSIGASNDASSDLNIYSTTASHVGLQFGNTRLHPTDNAGSTTDGVADLGFSNSRWKDIYGSGAIIIGDGSVTAPSVRGTDTNTGIFFPSAGVTAISRNGVEGCRMDASGNLLVGKTVSSSDTNGIAMSASLGVRSSISGNIAALFSRNDNDGKIVTYRKDNSEVGSISTNTYSLPSDRNFKREISDLDLGLNLITKLKPSQYNYKIDDENSPKMYGLIAQDLEKSLEEVGVEKNSVWLLQHEPNDNEKESDYSLDYQKLTPVLIKAIQELSTELETAKARIKTLEDA